MRYGEVGHGTEQSRKAGSAKSSGRDHVTVGEFAAQVGITAPAAYALVDAGVIRTIDLSAEEFRRRVIPAEEIERLRREGLPRVEK